jgi:Rrf2 family protein
MRVSQRLDYALRAAVLIAARPRGTYVSGAEVAAKLGLPQRVVEQQLSLLAREGLLLSRRGAGGGHALARLASQVSVADIVRAIEGTALDVPKVAGAAVSEFWGSAQSAFGAYLTGYTLEMLARRQTELDAAQSHIYYI